MFPLWSEWLDGRRRPTTSYTRETVIELSQVNSIINSVFKCIPVTLETECHQWERCLLAAVVELVKENDRLSQANQKLLEGRYEAPVVIDLRDVNREEAIKILQEIVENV